MDNWKEVCCDLRQDITELQDEKKDLEMDLEWQKNKRKQAEEGRDNALRKVKDTEVLLAEYARTSRRI